MPLDKDNIMALWRLIRPVQYLTWEQREASREVQYALNENQVFLELDKEELEALHQVLAEKNPTEETALYRLRNRVETLEMQASQDRYDLKVEYDWQPSDPLANHQE